MKILALSHSCVSDVNQQLFVALSRRPNVQVELIVPANWKSDITGQPQKPRLLPSVDFPVHQIPVVLPGHVSLHCYPTLTARRFRRFAPDVLLSSQEPWSLSHWQAAGLARRLKTPVIFHTNQNIWKRYPPPFSWIEQRSYRTATAALAYSEEAQQVMLRKGLRKPSFVVPYGIDQTLFHAADSGQLRRRLGLQDALVVGYLGRLVREKGLATLVEALKRLLRQKPMPLLKVLLAGTGPEEEALRRQVRLAGLADRFVFAGTVPHRQAGDYLRCMDIFVLPSRTTSSWKEQFGRVIIEALACEVPVVGSDSGRIPSLIRETGGGLVFAEADPADLALKLRSLVGSKSLRQQMGRTGCCAVQERYTFEAVAAQIDHIIGGLLASGQSERPAQHAEK